MAKREAYGHAWVETAPDPAPAVRLRRLLADDREHGLAFEDAWPEDVRVVLRGLNRKDASQWAIVFSATESAWMTAYERSETQIISLDGDLLLDAAA